MPGRYFAGRDLSDYARPAHSACTYYNKRFSFSMRLPVIVLLSLLTVFSAARARPVPKRGDTPESFIPEGWKRILQVSGDLNKDSASDVVLVIENTDPTNFYTDEGLGTDTLNLNPRVLLVLFKAAQGGYILAAKNDSGFVPPHSSDANPCLADPLMEDGDVEISRGVLRISYNYWLSCGSWYVSHATYIFRYQHAAFELIGFDNSSFHRASGEESGISVNFSTGKIATTSGGNEFEEASNKPKTKWREFVFHELLRLEECNAETYDKMLEL